MKGSKLLLLASCAPVAAAFLLPSRFTTQHQRIHRVGIKHDVQHQPQQPSASSTSSSRRFIATSPVSTSASTSNQTSSSATSSPTSKFQCDLPPFNNILAANRAEIAVRIMRAATELNVGTTAIYVDEDKFSQHRWGADKSFPLRHSGAPISAYLDIDQIIKVAKKANVDAIHPGYGFLSESPEFARACADAGIVFIGPTVDNLLTFSDKTSARSAAIAAGVPVVPGSDGPLLTAEDVVDFVQNVSGLPVILKASMGGGGKGMRVVRKMEDLKSSFEAASSEALASFGDGSVFVERFVDRPRHIEVQIIGDGTGNVVHLWERDCSVQRRHQKVIEMAPAWSLPDDLRRQLHEYAIKLTSEQKYKNAGTVEFLVDSELRPYFIEVNPRIQVEHTVTEEVTGIDLVQAQIKIAAGATLEEIGLRQPEIQPRGVAIQCRVTTEDPERDFSPDTGTISLYRHSAGKGVRMDGIGYSGMTVTPFFDSMIVKYTCSGATFSETVARMKRTLQECRIRGVKTNIGFLLNVLSHPQFESGIVTTSFIDENPKLKQTSQALWDFADAEQADPRKTFATERLIRYLANLAVNGQPAELGAEPSKLSPATIPRSVAAPKLPKAQASTHLDTYPGWRHILQQEGPAAYAKKVREHKGLLIMDTTWRDAHQSLLATRMRSKELYECAQYTNVALSNAFSLEMWGGATFDVSMRFLKECPWERLETLRELVPKIPFQMLLRGANAVGYTNYADDVVHRFCKQAYKSGIDVFRVFDSLNYLENLQLGVDAAGEAGGFVEGAMSYTGNVADPDKGKYSLEYYLNLADKLVDMGVHSLAIKDMAGLLTPRASTMLVGALRQAHPQMPIHVHTHDTAGCGVASMLAAAEAGADVVDAAIDAMSGMSSQPSLGALVASLRRSELDTGIDLQHLPALNSYWENVRSLYSPFESGQLSGSSDIFFSEVPGGQISNLLFQSKQLGLGDKWPEIKQKYAEANEILGDIPKVTPSSKVVGDLAQFMVAQGLDKVAVAEQADSLAFPDSVVNYLRGDIGIPPGGFPEPLRSKVLKSRQLEPIEGRPGRFLPPYDFDEEKEYLVKRYGENNVNEKELLSYAMYPKVYTDFKDFQLTFGEVGKLPTNMFLYPMQVGQETELELSEGRTLIIRLVSIESVQDDGTRMVLFQVNGEPWYMKINDLTGQGERTVREKVTQPGHVGSPMSGVVVGLKVQVGNQVTEGESVATLSAMKMETSIPATKSGTVKRILVTVGAKVDGDDLLMEIE